MTVTLKLTAKELDDLINGKFDEERFKVTFDDMPIYHPDNINDKGNSRRDYLEDDGREFRWLIFIDLKTGIEHYLNYTYNIEWPNDLMDAPTIQIVSSFEESDLYLAPEPVVEMVKELSLEESYDRSLWEKYSAIKHECRKVDRTEKLDVPVNKIADIFNLIYSKKFNMLQLRAVTIPVCIDYRLDDITFWHWIQFKTSKKMKAESVVSGKIKNVKEKTELDILWDKYDSIKEECQKFDKNEKLLLSREEILKIMALAQSNKEFHINDMRKLTLPICIKYKLEDQSFLSWVSEKAYTWKKQ